MSEGFSGVANASTTAGGWPSVMLHASAATLIASAFLVGPSVSTSAYLQGQIRPSKVQPQTNAGIVRQQQKRKRAAEGLSELRRSGGFTWDQLARLFRVTRRSLHFWASGQPMSAENEERLQRVLAFIAQADRGSPEETRFAILSPAAGGRIPFDLLAEGRYEEALALIGEGRPRDFVLRPARLPERPASWRPEELVEARTDRAHTPEPIKPSTRGRARRERA